MRARRCQSDRSRRYAARVRPRAVGWPIARHLGSPGRKPDFTGSDLLADLFVAADRSQSELRDDFDRKASEIDADPHLSDLDCSDRNSTKEAST